MLILLTAEPVITRRVRQLAEEHGLTVADLPDSPPRSEPGGRAAGGTDLAGAEPGEAELAGGGVPPVAAVIDLLRPDALERIRAWRAWWPDTLIAGHIGVPDRDLWVAAQRAGCDLVASRGALVPQLRDRLARSRDQRPERFPLFDVADAAGRLGLVCRVDETRPAPWPSTGWLGSGARSLTGVRTPEPCSRPGRSRARWSPAPATAAGSMSGLASGCAARLIQTSRRSRSSRRAARSVCRSGGESDCNCSTARPPQRTCHWSGPHRPAPPLRHQLGEQLRRRGPRGPPWPEACQPPWVPGRRPHKNPTSPACVPHNSAA